MNAHVREITTFVSTLRKCRECQVEACPMPGSGSDHSALFFIKSCPSEEEVRAGFAFAGQSGTAMLAAFDALMISPLSTYGTNAVKCPSGQVERCVAHLANEIAAVDPSIIVTMGPVARKALELLADTSPANPSNKALDWRSKTIISITEDPLKALGDPASKRQFWAELKASLPRALKQGTENPVP